MSAFLITWRPTGEIEGSGWPEPKLLALVNKFVRQGSAVEPWTFRPYRIAKEGDRVFLNRQGHRGHALFGYGRISAIPKPYRGLVDVRFEGLVNPALATFATPSDLKAITTERMVWGTRHSGYKLPEDVAMQLERLVVGRSPIEFERPVAEESYGVTRGKPSISQNREALRLLSVVKRVLPTHRLLTYKSAALELGRPASHARAVAQVCDLLDAATALAKVPLLALIAVREASGDINRKAWTGSTIPAGLKDQIIKQSLAHRFVDRDFAAIANALRELDGLGNHAAWEEVRRRFRGAPALHRSLVTYSYDDVADAIDDLGSDDPERRELRGSTYVRDSNVRKEVERRAQGRCEYCGQPGFLRRDRSKYVETHHIIALAKDGADRVTNVIGLCPNHHKEAHFGSQSKELEQQMIVIVSKFYERQPQT
jgi:HNH endonuclease